MLFFLALGVHPKLPELVLIEEPEKGVHPGRLGDIVKVLRSLSEEGHAPRPIQIVMTTHSPYLMDFIDPERDQVLIFRRSETGARTVTPADPSRLRLFLDEFNLGEVWYNRGEDGLVGPTSS